jgi:Ca-activated chloride channel family protein
MPRWAGVAPGPSEVAMKRKVLWAFLGVGAAGALTAAYVPSLLRARVSTDGRRLAEALRPAARPTFLPVPPPVRPDEPAAAEALPVAPSPATVPSRRAAEAQGLVAGAAAPKAVAKLRALGFRMKEAAGAETATRDGEDKEEDRASGFNTEAYDRIVDNAFLAAASNPLSTFSIDVDTASYANVRRFLASGQLPPKDAVRIEELVNYFRYDYAQPAGAAPFSVTTELSACPWKADHRLVLIGLQGRLVEEANVPPRNLVFLLDVSGSMDEPRKLPLLKESLGLLVEQLRPQDRVAIVVYAGASGLALPPTPGDRKETIRRALESLQAGGSTAGGAGIELAYRVASDSFVRGGINRVILATDGDFNVGITSQGDLLRLIEEKRRTGVFLSVLGFGDGNLKDSTMEKLADSGNGNYAYIDSLAEGRKVLVSEAGATLVTIAKDVKIQVEFNPARVAAYRLIGYENRSLRAEDFNDDGKDAGEIGAGHSVTALYEVVPAGVAIELPGVDPLKYQRPASRVAASQDGELLTVKLRYKEPDGERSRLLSVALADRPGAEASENLRFSAAVAAFGMLLRESEHKGQVTYGQVLALAEGSRGDDREGYRSEFVELVRAAEGLAGARRVSAIR